MKELVRKYAELQAKEEALKLEKASLKEQIVAEMDSLSITKWEDVEEGLSANIVLKETVKYTDEPAIIKWAKENGYGSYVVEKVDTTKFNKQLKTSNILNESVGTYLTKTVAPSLTVKEIK